MGIGLYRTYTLVFPQFFDFFRPPYGALTEEQKEHVREIPLANFYWNIDSRDYAIKDPEKLLTYVLKKIEDHKERGIVLLHDYTGTDRTDASLFIG